LDIEILEDRCMPSTFAAFDLSAPNIGPFPSDRFTVADTSQLTGLRVDLPLPDQGTRPSDYNDIRVINTLDGFNLQPRLSVAFSGAIDVNTVNSNDMFLIRLGDTQNPQDRGGEVVGINQVVWDPATSTLHVESEQLLDQHTRYALIVTDGLRDGAGQAVQASADFQSFRHDLNFGQADDPALKAYRKELIDALAAASQDGILQKDVVTASVFTTMSATALLEKMRDQIHAATPEPASFLLGPGGTRTEFALDQLSGITFNRQTTVAGPLSPVPVSLSVLHAIPGAIGTIAFGSYLSPDYEVHPGEYIPPVGTDTGTPVVQHMSEVYFNLFLPSGAEPAGGWPVTIFGHGSISNKNGDPLQVAASMAAHGIATIAINIDGYGFGPQSTLTVSQPAGAPVTFLAGGRSIDQNGDGIIDNGEGQFATAPRTIIGETDALRQTAADLMQLVQVIQVGMDVYGNGSRDLDPSRISYSGFSLGASLGTMLFAVEPNVRAATFSNPSGSRIEALRLGARRSQVGALLAARVPSLVNSPGITAIGGLAVAGPWFNENLPLRDGLPLTVRLADGTTQVIQSPVINTVAGAMEIQEVFENREWVSQTANPVAFAPHLREDPLLGVPVRPVLFQFAIGDQIAPNPTNAAILRAGDLADRATLYRTDLAFAEDPAVPKNPHGFMLNIDSTDPLVRQIAFGAQEQIATFFETDGQVVIHPEPARFFETPIRGPLPEGLNFITGPLPKTQLTINNVTVTASDTGTVTAVFTVSLSTPSMLPVTVTYSTADGTTTVAGNDYVPTSGTLTFAPGETTQTITVVINPDRRKDADKTFFVDLSGAINALLLDDEGLGTIVNV
jgi:hypothetical protein